MRFNNLSLFVIPTLSLLIASEVAAQKVLNVKNPDFGEIDADKAFGAGSMIAAHRMGAWGMASPAQLAAVTADVNNPDLEGILLLDCQNNSNTSWPEQCSPQKMVVANSTHFKQYGQKWSMLSYDITKKALAISTQISAMKAYETPIVAPVWGQVDHWIAIRQMITDDLYKTLLTVKYFDAGPDGFADQKGNAFEFGLITMAGGTYSGTYYSVIPSNDIAANDPNVDKHIFSYDPPVGGRQPPRMPPVRGGRGEAVVAAGEMTEDLAPVLVWDALELHGVLADPELAVLHTAVAGDAWTVRGVWPSGEPWDYVVVPMYDERMEEVLGFVGLSADDGAFEQVHMLDRPRALDLPRAAEASRRARGLLRAGEVLGAGALVWDPRCSEVHCSQPMLPYHEFAVRTRSGAAGGRITIPMGGLAARRR